MGSSQLNSNPLAHWWTRVSGGREVLRIAMPLVISSLSLTIMTFVDRLFLKQVSAEAMAAAFTAGTVWFAVACLPLGLCAYSTTFVSQYLGNGQPERIGGAIWQGVWLALGITPFLLFAIPFAPTFFQWVGHSQDAVRLEVVYFQILCWGGPGMLIAQSLTSFFSGRGQTRTVMGVDATVAIINLVLDYLWIFGHAGFPEMGIAGAAWATVTAFWLKAAIYLILVLSRENRRIFETWRGMSVDRDLLKRLLWYGSPSGFQLLLDVLGFTVFILMVGRLGHLESQATSIAFSVGTLAFMPVWGLSQAVSILVGQRLGQNRDDLAARATWTSLWIALSYMALISLAFLFAPNLFLAAFFTEAAPSDNSQETFAMAVTLLQFVAAYNMLDALLMIFVSAIKGAGDTPFVLRASFPMAVLLGGLSWVGVEVLEFGIYGCWALVAGWVWCLGVIFMLRFLGGKWRRMRVIDMATTSS